VVATTSQSSDLKRKPADEPAFFVAQSDGFPAGRPTVPCDISTATSLANDVSPETVQ